MEGEEGFKVGKKKSTAGDKGGEVDYRTKAGTAWSHNFLNQKPWHPLSYPNQRRKWIAEQTHAHRQRRSEEVAREYAQEQEFFRQTALITKKEKEKLELMKSVSFMYVKPPGYNAESAKAAETADEKKMQEQDTDTQELQEPSASTSKHEESEPPVEKKKRRVKDIYGRALPTEEEFDALKNAPRLETGLAARAKPFGIEIRNVKCLRCGKYGHQSGDRECPLKDTIMPNEENRLKREDPLTAIQAQTEPCEPLKWELKQQPGMSPPRGGFKADDPNQQIVAEDIFDEYGGFLSEAIIPELLTDISLSMPRKKSNKKKKHKKYSSASPDISDKDTRHSSDDDKMREFKNKKSRKQKCSESSSSESSEHGRRRKKSNRDRHHRRKSLEASDFDEPHKTKRHLSTSHRHHRRNSSESSESDEPYRSKHDRSSRHKHHYKNASEASDSDEQYRSKHDLSNSHRHRRMKSSKASQSDKARRTRDDRSSRHKDNHGNYSDSSDPDEARRSKHNQSTRHKHLRRSSSEASGSEYRSKHDHQASDCYLDRDGRRHSVRFD